MQIDWNTETEEWDYVIDDDLLSRISVSDNATTLTYEQYAILGVPTPPKQGWKGRLLGTLINERQYAALLVLRKRKREAKARKNAAFEKRASRTINQSLAELMVSAWGTTERKRGV